jgi:hypothetical protein
MVHKSGWEQCEVAQMGYQGKTAQSQPVRDKAKPIPAIIKVDRHYRIGLGPTASELSDRQAEEDLGREVRDVKRNVRGIPASPHPFVSGYLDRWVVWVLYGFISICTSY